METLEVIVVNHSDFIVKVDDLQIKITELFRLSDCNIGIMVKFISGLVQELRVVQ